MTDSPTTDRARDLAQVPGWFYPSDVAMFRFVLGRQQDRGQTGGLVELGSYLGKSAIVMGDYLRPGETFTVVDLFGAEADDVANAEENATSYPTLTRDAFEQNYLRFHDELPSVHTALSSALPQLVEAGSARFVHVDASHLYLHVAGDVDAARQVLGPDGVVCFDDYRSEHTPGVSAAVWEAVLLKGLRPVAVTASKLYGTWGDPDALREDLLAHLQVTPKAWWEVQDVAGHQLVRCKFTDPPATTPAARPATPATARPSAATGPSPRVARLRRRVEELENEVTALRGSTSFRVGRALTAPGRALRRR